MLRSRSSASSKRSSSNAHITKEEHDETARRLDGAWEIAAASRSRGLVDAARGGLVAAAHALERAVAVGERVPMMLELGQSLLAVGEVQRRLAAQEGRAGDIEPRARDVRGARGPRVGRARAA